MKPEGEDDAGDGAGKPWAERRRGDVMAILPHAAIQPII